MIRPFIFISLAALLAACQPSSPEGTESAIEDAPQSGVTPQVQTVEKDGQIRVILQTPVSEPRACIIPIRIENGLENPTNVTMIGFSVTGPGEDARGNMFAPVAASGEVSEARVILEGQSCDAFNTLTVPEVLCTSGDEDCRDLVELKDGGGLSFTQAG